MAGPRAATRRALAALANVCWLLCCLPEVWRFRRAVADVEREQRAVLARILRGAAGTRFAHLSGVRADDTAEQFAEKVPLTDYEGLADLIAEAGEGAPDVLTREPVLLFEPTGGSTGGTKLIPVTAASKREFGRALSAWIGDMYLADPAALLGCAYFSLSPVGMRDRRTDGGIPIGFDEDAEYFGPVARALVGLAQAVPPEVRLIEDMDAFRYVTSAFLLARADLTLVSVWNPTFFSALLDTCERHAGGLARDIAEGRLCPPSALSGELAGSLGRALGADPSRAGVIAAAFARGPDRAAAFEDIWPRLRIVSCWADANAERYSRLLAEQLPHARIAPKGLVATEGIASLPIEAAGGHVLAVRSHYFEFEPPSGPPLPAWRARAGERYGVVLTSGSGLYRYRLRDTVEVTGSWRGAPILRFLGKESMVSDWFGEKIDESHARRVIAAVAGSLGSEPAWALVACEEFEGGYAYALFLELDGGLPSPTFDADDLARVVESGLAENFHYAYARRLGQLGHARVVEVTDGAAAFLAESVRRGRRAGDVKPLALSPQAGWLGPLGGRPIGGHAALPRNGSAGLAAR